MLALVRAQQSCRPRLTAASRAVRNLPALRGIHQTPVALKKKKKGAVSDDLFATEDESFFDDGGDLFSVGETAKAKASAAPSAAEAGTAKKLRGKLNAQERLERFNTLFQFVDERIGLHPPARAARKPEQVRTTAWQHLFGLAMTKEQLEQVTEIFPKWREARREWTPQTTYAFVRRCEELRCPELALKVFSDHPKYGVDLTDQKTARQLLHSLHVEHPLEKSITLTALHGVYKLPAISQDLISCAMLTSACFKAGTPESLTVANALVPELQQILQKTKPETWAYPKDPSEKNKRKDKTWLTWTLTKIEKALSKQNQPFDWLRKWREQSGHAQIAT